MGPCGGVLAILVYHLFPLVKRPPLAHRALEVEPDLGVRLPCNVVVYERASETHISAVDAERMLSIVGNDELAAVAAEVRDRLATVVEHAAVAWRR